jgi:uncharacterized protein (TIGR02145 family)
MGMNSMNDGNLRHVFLIAAGVTSAAFSCTTNNYQVAPDDDGSATGDPRSKKPDASLAEGGAAGSGSDGAAGDSGKTQSAGGSDSATGGTAGGGSSAGSGGAGGTGGATKTITDERDGKAYAFVTIGDQDWFAENLRYEPAVGKTWCWDDIKANCKKFGRYYDQAAALNGNFPIEDLGTPSLIQGACPNDWYLPSEEDYRVLTTKPTYKLRSTTGWGKEYNGTDAFGFNLKPNGNWVAENEGFGNKGTWALLWTATNLVARGFVGEATLGYGWDTEDGLNVRCMRRN